MDVLLSPHNDDAELFAAFLCLRYEPHVAVCLRSRKQGDNWARRELETAAAMDVLGCTWEQWIEPDTAPSWPNIRSGIIHLGNRFDRCFAPWPRFAQNGWSGADPMPADGACQHDRIGEIAQEVFRDRYVGYLTYTKAGKDEMGDRVSYEPEWVKKKFQALLCHGSQIVRPEIAPHFLRGLDEYTARETPLPQKEENE